MDGDAAKAGQTAMQFAFQAGSSLVGFGHGGVGIGTAAEGQGGMVAQSPHLFVMTIAQIGMPLHKKMEHVEHRIMILGRVQ